MPSQNGKTKKWLTVYTVIFTVVLLIFVVVGFRYGSSSVLSPIEQVFMDFTGSMQRGLSTPTAWIRHLWHSYIALQDVKLENEILRSEIERLQEENVRYREALIANARLKMLLGIKKRVKTATLTADVVGLDLAPWSAVLTVNAGRKSGIKQGMVVLSGAGVIGQVISVSLNYSRVLLASDYSSAIAVLVQRNRARAILKGAGQGRCSLAYVEKDVDIEIGDNIITSGTDRIFPKGLLVGKVSSVDEGSVSDLFQTVYVTPVTDLEKIEEVVILLKGQPLVEALN